MLSPKFCTIENVERIKYVQIAIAVLSAVICGYFIVSGILSMRDIWTANRSLHNEQAECLRISRDMKKLRADEAIMPHLTDGGMEQFAVEFSEWANERGLNVEAVVPEGTSSENEITVGNEKMGTWNSNKLRVQGSGDFEKLANLLDEFRKPQLPVQLESFSFESSENCSGVVRFDLVMTVYEKKNEGV